MLESWQAVVLGLVEGVTEYLPVSSTGHLILAESLLGVRTPDAKEGLDAFTIVIQGGAILAVLGLYWQHVLAMLRGVLGRDPVGLRLLVNLGVAFLPAAVVGLALDHWIERNLFHPLPVLGALAGGGVFMIALHRLRGRIPGAESRGIESIDLSTAAWIGAMQCLALWPGMSRSMVVIAGGLLAGLRPRDAAEFSFLLGLPTLGAATAWKLFKEREAVATLGVAPVLLGIAVATVSAALAVRWLVGFLNRRGLEPFGWYRLALTGAFAAALAVGWVELGAVS
ncbi:MAG TPA: undecaprenyl-diphosphate phosphatase [Myxococcota bacterium]|nr:undecaprenyl-diphosphate phosphatase [Myxococcota bacterium]